MLKKLVDTALSTTFQAAYFFSKFRHRLTPTTMREKDLLTEEWFEAHRKKAALQAELDRPTTSRLYGAQVKLMQATKAAGDHCYELLLKLRARRKRTRDSGKPPQP